MSTVKPVSIADNTPDGARAFIEHAKRSARNCFREFCRKPGGQLMPVAMLVGDRDPKTFAMLERPAYTVTMIDPNSMQSHQTKGALVEALNQLAVGAGAFGIALVTEIWMKRFAGEDHRGRAEEEVRRLYSSGKMLRDLPASEREEAVLVSVDHRALPSPRSVEGKPTVHVWVAMIHRPRGSKPRLGPWLEHGAAETRFQRLLPDDDYLNRAARALDMMIALARGMGLPKERAADVIAKGEYWRPGMPPPGWLAQRIREMDW